MPGGADTLRPHLVCNECGEVGEDSYLLPRLDVKPGEPG
jgi:hypothetical protein